MRQWQRGIVAICILALAAPALAGGYRNSISTDLVGWGLLEPNVSYERRMSNLFSVSGSVSFDARAPDQGIVATPHLNFYPTGALREGYLLQVGAYLPTEGDILAEFGAGHAFWVDRMHLTPAARIRHDGSYQVRLDLGYGWY